MTGRLSLIFRNSCVVIIKEYTINNIVWNNKLKITFCVDEDNDEPQSCRDDALLCHKFSDCHDRPEGGFCCRCQKGYFGDGRNCLDYGKITNNKNYFGIYIV